MVFSGKGRRAIQWMALCAAVLAALAACGGGSTQQTAFKPTRVIAFGDESSVITSSSRKYAVNALDANDGIDCATNPIWVQTVASIYGYVFAECNPSASALVNALGRAAPGAKIDDVRAQIDTQVATGGVASTDLVLLLAGANDVLALYTQFPSRSEADIIDDAKALGLRLASQANRLVDQGARVIISTVPDMGLTPYGVAQKAAFNDTDRAALLTRITSALNAQMRVNILNDGRFVGLVLADEMVQAMVRSPISFSLTNAVDPACTVALPNCTTKTLVDTATAATWLWADATRLSAGGQTRLGLLAQQRAQGNPF